MKNTEILKRINALLYGNVKLAQETLADGTVIEASSWEVGSDVYLVNGEEKTPLGIGSYTLANGTVITVVETGKVGEVVSAETEVEVEVEAEDKVVEEIAKEEVMAEVPATLEEILTAVVEAIQPKFDDLQAKIDALSGSQTEMKETLSSKVVKKATIHKPTYETNNTKANLSSTQARIFAMLSK